MTVRALIAALTFVSCASAAEYSRRVWRIEDGLPQNKIQALAQTPDGYLWIGTSGGLVRFDGARFVVFDRSNTPGLRDDSILSLRTVRDGSLWIGTEGGGLTHMHGDVFDSWDTAQGLANGFVGAIWEDTPGRLLIGTHRGIFRFANSRFTRLDAKGDLPILAGRAIYGDRGGTIWIAASGGLYRFENEKLIPVSVSGVGGIFSFAEGDVSGMWVAGPMGLGRLANGAIMKDNRFDAASARSLIRDHAGNLWVGSNADGLRRIAGDVVDSFHSPEILPDESVLSLLEDRERNLWVGTQDGLLRLTETTVRTLNSKQGLDEDSVSTIYRDPSSTLWLSTVSGILYRMAGEKPVRVNLRAPANGFRARNIYVDRAGVQWIGSLGQGAIRIENGNAVAVTAREGLRSNSIRAFLEDGSGAMWIATGSGLSRWSGGALRSYYLEDGLAYGSVRALARDVNGDVLVGTEGGINRVRGSRFISDPVFTRLGNKRVWAILADSDGTLWLGTRGDGLIRISGNTVTRYTTNDGLPGNTIYQILDDGAGRFWMSGAAGVFSVQRAELVARAKDGSAPLAIVPYGAAEGMLTSQMNGGMQTAGSIAADGEVWFPSVKGAVRILPKQTRTTAPAPVLIESVTLDGRPIPAGETIPPGSNRLRIDFTSANLASPDRVSFRYKLEGFDDSWIPALKRRSVWYTNLPPRKYRFRVLAQDVAQPRQVSEATVEITQRPHFYESGWFFAAILAALAIAIWGAFGFYARQTKARYALVLAERTRLAREMHDTVIQGCVGVSTLLEAARSMPESAAAKSKDLVERAATQIRLTVNEAREAVWDLRHSGVEHGLTDTLRNFAQQVSEAEGIPVLADIDGAPSPLNDDADRNLLLVAREAVRNAVLHSEARQINVKLRFDAAEVRLEVSDNGRGFNAQKPRNDGHYGIVGMRERVEQSGGSFELHSVLGKGTSVIAKLPPGKARTGTGVKRG